MATPQYVQHSFGNDGCFYRIPDYRNMFPESLRDDYRNIKCRAATGVPGIIGKYLDRPSYPYDDSIADWEKICSAACMAEPNCLGFNKKKRRKPKRTWSCELLNCNGDFVYYLDDKEDRAGYFDITTCTAQLNARIPPGQPTFPPVLVPTMPPNGLVWLALLPVPLQRFSANNGACVIEYVDYDSLSNTDRAKYALTRCNGQGILASTSIVQNSVAGDWRNYCTQQCVRNPQCNMFSKINVPGDAFQCRLHNCNPYNLAQQDMVDFVTVTPTTNPNDRSAWIVNDLCTRNSPVYAPTNPPVVAPVPTPPPVQNPVQTPVQNPVQTPVQSPVFSPTFSSPVTTPTIGGTVAPVETLDTVFIVLMVVLGVVIVGFVGYLYNYFQNGKGSTRVSPSRRGGRASVMKRF